MCDEKHKQSIIDAEDPLKKEQLKLERKALLKLQKKQKKQKLLEEKLKNDFEK